MNEKDERKDQNSNDCKEATCWAMAVFPMSLRIEESSFFKWEKNPWIIWNTAKRTRSKKPRNLSSMTRWSSQWNQGALFLSPSPPPLLFVWTFLEIFSWDLRKKMRGGNESTSSTTMWPGLGTVASAFAVFNSFSLVIGASNVNFLWTKWCMRDGGGREMGYFVKGGQRGAIVAQTIQSWIPQKALQRRNHPMMNRCSFLRHLWTWMRFPPSAHKSQPFSSPNQEQQCQTADLRSWELKQSSRRRKNCHPYPQPNSKDNLRLLPVSLFPSVSFDAKLLFASFIN